MTIDKTEEIDNIMEQVHLTGEADFEGDNGSYRITPDGKQFRICGMDAKGSIIDRGYRTKGELRKALRAFREVVQM